MQNRMESNKGTYHHVLQVFRSTGGLLSHGLWRLMLDEAQLVATSSSVAGQAVSELFRRHAWVVTGVCHG